MKEISATDKRSIINNLISNEVVITFPRNPDIQDITMANIINESMKIKDAICDEGKLIFGGCIASEFTIDLIDSATRIFTASELVGQWISVKIIQYYVGEDLVYPSNSLYPSSDIMPGQSVKKKTWWVFSGYIDKASAKKTDKHVRSIIAYDFLALLLSDKSDASNVLTSLWQKALSGTTTANYPTVQDLLNCAFNSNDILSESIFIANEITALPYEECEYLNELAPLESGETELTMPIKNFRTMNAIWLESTDMLTWGEVVRNIGELFGLFGRVCPDDDIGVFRFISLGESEETYSFYESLLFDDEIYHKGYTGAKVTVSDTSTSRNARNRTIYTLEYDEAEESIAINTYNMTSNILAWEHINPSFHRLEALFFSATGSRYFNSGFTPLLVSVDTRLWVEPGDKINVAYMRTDYEGSPVYDDNNNPIYDIVSSYVLSRTTAGIMALTDEIEAKGEY